MKTLVKNPLGNEISIAYHGVKYSLKAGESKEVSEEVAGFWKKTHSFLEVGGAIPRIQEAASLTPTAISEPISQEPEQAPVEEEKKEEKKSRLRFKKQ